MKINNETKVGVLAIIAVVILVVGYNFLKGKSIFKKTKHIYAVFSNLSGLDKSNQVTVNGLAIGTVSDITEKDKEVNGIVVTINLTRNVNIPNNSVAHISEKLVGSSSITINMGTSKVYLQDKDTIPTEVISDLLGDLTAQVTPTLSKARDAIDSLKALLGGMNRLFDPATKGNIQAMIGNLTLTSARLQTVLDVQAELLEKSLGNVHSITENLASNNERITNTLQNLERSSSKFANLNLQHTIDTLNQTVNSLKNFASKLNSNEGSLGALVNDKTLYNNLNYTAVKLETLIDDIRMHPKRYVNISLFGGKNKGGPITSPEKLDTVFRVGKK